MADESPFGLYLNILETFERLGNSYVVIGAFAGMSYGVTRLTVDVDIVVELNDAQIQATLERTSTSCGGMMKQKMCNVFSKMFRPFRLHTNSISV